MRFHSAPRSLQHLLTAILFAPQLATTSPNPHPSEAAGFSFNELFARYECNGQTCGYYGQVCCGWGSTCYTNAANQAECTTGAQGAPITQAAGSGGYWQTYTTTWVETDLITKTAILSTYIAGGAEPTGAACNWALNEQQCGSICCASGQYCQTEQNICLPAAGGGSSGWYSTPVVTAGPGIRPTTSAWTTVTETLGPTTTEPFVTPVATGANITLTEDHANNGGLSGGAIAGIVIGVLFGLALLGLLCFCCCIRGLLDGCLACFGLGKRKRRTVEVEERYSRHSNRQSGSGAGGGRTWYGAARPATRVSRRDDRSSSGKNLLGIGAGLAALWAILGLKRKRDNRHDEKSEYSYSSDYYTSASSASSDDRRTRDTRRSMSRR